MFNFFSIMFIYSAPVFGGYMVVLPVVGVVCFHSTFPVFQQMAGDHYALVDSILSFYL